jgi:hypothetical protein
MKSSYRLNKAGIFFIALILLSHMLDCSMKVKTNTRLRARMRKAGIKVKSETGLDCSATSILGKSGSCINLNPAGLNNYMPSDFSPAWSVLGPVISKTFPAGPQFCYGDFKGSAFDENEDLSSDLCNTIPVETGGTFGVIGTSLSGLPCGAPTDASMCITFDKCGTFAIAFNPGVPACIAYYGGAYSGVIAAMGAAASLVGDVVGNFSLGFSLGRRFSTDVRLAYRDGDKVHSGTITTYGHLFLDVGIEFPTDFLKFGKRDLSSYFSLSADILFLIDFGDVDTVATSMINTLKNANKNTAKTLLKSIVSAGYELTMNIDGTLTLGLEDMTKGILCDFSFTLASATVLLTGGSGRSGLEAGVYFRLGSNFISDMINSLQGIVDNFSDIFSKLGMGSFTLPSVGIELGLFLTTSAFGFQFTALGFTFKCMFLYDSADFSCAINAKIFTMIMDGLNFVFKNAAKFFDKTGSIIATKTAAEFKAATKVISKRVKESVGYVKNSAGTLVKLGSAAFTDLKNEFDENLKWMKNGYKNATKRASKVLSQVANVAKKKAELAACDLKYALNKRKKKKCKNSVKDKYDNDSNNQTLGCPSNEYEYTSFTSDGNGAVLNLANHTMDCGSGKFINEFKLERKDSNLRYRYKCVYPNQTSTNPTCVIKKTLEQITNTFDPTHSADFLDQHTVKCDSGFGLNKVVLKRSTSTTSNIYYEYTCCTIPQDSCTDMETQNGDRGDKSTYNLDQLDVDAGKNRILSGFKLNNIGDEQWNYSYQSCGVLDKVNTYFDSGCDDDGDGSIFYLDRHTVDCGKGNLINQFQLRRESETIRYDYTCVYSKSISDTCTIHKTPVNDTKSGDSTHSAHYLDRHDVTCPTGYGLSKFELQRSGSRDIYYEYTCCQASFSSCTDQTTSTQDGGNHQTYYLDRQNVDATGFNALSRFKLNNNSKGDWSYSIKVCKLS